MKYRKFLVAPIVIILLLSLLIRGEGTPVQAVSQGTVGTWSIVKSANPSTTESVLLGVTALGSTHAWAVGYYHDDTANTTRDLIEHWNGTRWSVVAHPGPDTTSAFLFHVTTISPENVWAVGRYTDSSFNQLTLIEHWNGSTWELTPSPNPGPTFNTLSSIVAISAANIWAIGFYVNDDGNRQTLIEHWNGRAWELVASPNLQGRSNVLSSIAALSANDVWAVGDAPDINGNYVTLVEHWNGSVWRIVKSPNPSPTFSHLYGVTAIAPDDVWAVGFYGAFTSLVVHWNGRRWDVAPSPNPGTDSNVLNAVTAASPQNIWAVGNLLNSGTTPHALTMIQHWDGSQWSVVSSPSARAGSNYLSDITSIPGTGAFWSVGYYYDSNNSHPQTLVEYYHP
jgi:hypothetical protein